MVPSRASVVLGGVAALWVTLAAAQGLRNDEVDVVTSSGDHPFSVEVMRTEPELERGLMYRRHLSKNAGMLFDFGAPRSVTMWMKNTILPLDMLFVGQDGRIVSVKENAEPQSEAIIYSGGLVTGVLEVNAGTARRIGAKPGDVVRHPMFGDKSPQ